jgi:hypothetical protein
MPACGRLNAIAWLFDSTAEDEQSKWSFIMAETH